MQAPQGDVQDLLESLARGDALGVLGPERETRRLARAFLDLEAQSEHERPEFVLIIGAIDQGAHMTAQVLGGDVELHEAERDVAHPRSGVGEIVEVVHDPHAHARPALGLLAHLRVDSHPRNQADRPPFGEPQFEMT